VAAIKNCSFSVQVHEALLDEKHGILLRLLLPIAGSEGYEEDDVEGMFDELVFLEPTKTREVDVQLKRMILETIILLTTTRYGRDVMRQRKVYPVLREFDKQETDDTCKDHIMQIVDMLMRDESKSLELTEDGVPIHPDITLTLSEKIQEMNTEAHRTSTVL
jgi:hypothetical protein